MTSPNEHDLLNQYLKETKSLLPLLRRQEKEYFDKMEENLHEVLESDESMTLSSMEDCYRILGRPNEIIHQYYSGLDMASYASAVSLSKLRNRIMIAAVSVMLVLVLSLLVIMWQAHQSFLREEVFFKTTEITEELNE
ncbi:MAG: hypothetical protein IKO03_10110 [Lachnospiraceae bacterium]|nr:hypothetical protein [Lachnospiraceae bacterium]MBR4607286.1 hypothetical protein [Lachnospiraceae bacterium]